MSFSQENKVPNAVSARKREAWLDLGRLLWIAGIALYHFDRDFGGPLGPIAKVGGQGVYFFLFASGYGLGRSSSANMGYGEFLRRRLGKVMIPFWVLAAFFVVLAPWLGHTRPTPFNIATIGLGLTAFWTDDMPTAWWFITGILQCYLVFPLLVRWSNRPWAMLAGVTGLFVARAAAVTLLIPPGAVDPTYRSLPAVLPAFTLGVVLARNNVDVRRWVSGWNIAWILGLEALGAVATLKIAAFSPFNDLMFIPFAVALPIWGEMLWSRFVGPVTRRLDWTPSFTMAIFLTHEWSLRRLSMAFPHHPLQALPAFLAISILVGWLGMLLINRLSAPPKLRPTPAPRTTEGETLSA